MVYSQEHKRREPNCPFFELATKYEAARVKPKKGKSTRQSKASRISSQSVITTQTERSSISALDDDQDDTVLTVDSIATTGSKASKIQRGTAASKKGGRKKKVAAVEDIEMPDSPAHVEEPEKPKRAPRRQASRVVSSQIDADDESQSKPKRQPRGKKARVEEPKPPTPPKETRTSQDSLNDASMDTVIYHDPEEDARVSRGMKRTSDGVPKATSQKLKAPTKSQQQLDSSLVILDEAPANFIEKVQRAKRGKKAAAATEKSSSEEIPIAFNPEPKSKKTKTTSTKRQPLGELEPEAVQQESERLMRLTEIGTQLVNDLEEEEIMNGPTPKEPGTPVVSDRSSDEPPTPTPARIVLAKLKRASLKGKKRSSLFEPKKTTAPTPILERKQSTPSVEAPSPQSSDAENRPPSARPEAVRKGLQLRPVSPLRPISNQNVQMTPKRQGSPSKFVVSRLKTSVPWSPRDVEEVMRATSPSKYLVDEKENFPADLDISNPEKLDLKKAVEAVNQRMSSPEKRMTVEEWIKFRAEKAHERLRNECETLVTAFEREGERAMRALEGVELER
jgi:hypothetical protein